jgi:hypothetical protein
MPVPIGFLRGVLAVLCIFFAYMAGRSAAMVRRGKQKQARLFGWLIRVIICGGAVMFREGLDSVSIGVWSAAVVAFAGAMWEASRQKPPEDLTDQIFRD